eukprot:c22172_g1_i1 orf=3-2435(-)
MGCLKGLPYFSSSLLVYCLTLVASCCLASYSAPSSPAPFPSNLKIGALFAYNSTIGKVAEQMLQLAIQNVNNDSDLLPGIELQLELADSACDPIQGSASAVALVKKGVVAIVGPQSSVVSHIVAHIGRASRIPILSFGATDPSLSERQYPYFYRVAPSDAMQMEAVAALISHFGWKEIAMIYTDDDYGANGASALRESLQKRGSRLAEPSIIIPGSTNITGLCAELKNAKSRVIVLHTPEELGFRVLSEASNLDMMVQEYVWIVTDLIANRMVSPDLDPKLKKALQGLIGIRRYVPPSSQLQDLLAQWQEKYPADIQSLDLSHLNTYGLYAYDAVFTIAHAISSHLAQGNNFTFTDYRELHPNFKGEADYQQMRVLQSGAALRENFQRTNFSGTSGHIEFDGAGGTKDADFEYVNMVGGNPVVVAYWASKNPQYLSLNLTDGNLNITWRGNTSDIPLVWLGNTSDIPLGWVPPKNKALLKIGVPLRRDYTEFVRIYNSSNITRATGYCIDVFEAAMRNLSYTVSFEYVFFSSQKINPLYDDLISKVQSKELDGAVGDITITADREKQVAFTQPFYDTGLVVLKRRSKELNNRWAFLQPFSGTMWAAILGFTLFTGLMIFILEHRVNEEFHGTARQQCGVMLWFIFSTCFQTHREGMKTVCGRAVLILWLFVVLALTTSYGASLTAFLTVQQLTPAFEGLESLLRSNASIGFQTGSFAKGYLVARRGSPAGLVDFNSQADYKKALDIGPNEPNGVAAIVDEFPYVERFLQNNCNKYTKATDVFEKTGWGFVSYREKPFCLLLVERSECALSY